MTCTSWSWRGVRSLFWRGAVYTTALDKKLITADTAILDYIMEMYSAYFPFYCMYYVHLYTME